MSESKMPTSVYHNAEKTTPTNDEELSFLDYQENVLKTKEEKRTRLFLIVITVGLYLLGLGVFASLTQTVYQINKDIGMYLGIGLLAVYTICFIVVICGIYSKHSFDLDYKRKGRHSERKNNKVRWEIANNINEQAPILHYIEEKLQKDKLKEKEAMEVKAYETIIRLTVKHHGKGSFAHSKDSRALAEALSVAMRKDGVIYKRAQKMIFARSVATGALTAISQSTLMDSGIVVMKNIQLIKDLVWLYGFRPSNREMSKIMVRVIRAVCVAIGINTFGSNSANFLSKIINKNSANIIVSIIGQAINMGAQLVGNGVMTYLIGKYTLKVMLDEFAAQEIFRTKDLEDYQIEMSNETVNAINNEIASETKRYKEKEVEPVKKDGEA